MKRTVLAIAMAALGNGPALATPTPEAATQALQAYAAAAGRATTFAELKGHWSMRFASVNDALYAQQLQPLPAEMRARLEKNLLRAVADNAAGALKTASVTCAAARCTARATLSSGATQTYWLVDEGGSMVIDDANTAVGP